MRRFLLLLLFLLTRGASATEYSIAWDPTWYSQDFKQKTIAVNAFTRELLLQLEKKGSSVRLVNLNHQEMFQELREGKIDALLTTQLPTQENLQKYDFSKPLLSLAPVLVVARKSPITSLDDMDEQVVGISAFDNSVQIVEKYPGVIIKEYENMPMALTDLARGSIDGVVFNNLEAYPLVLRLYCKSLKILPAPLGDEGIRLITPKGEHRELLDLMNATLNHLHDSSAYYKLRKKFELW